VKLSIAYLTFRSHPRFEWFAASLARELRSMPDVAPESIEVIVVDGRLWYDAARPQELRDAAAGRIHFTHVPPKPSVWQGPHRKTKKDYFCAASARNTALCYARAPHVVFVDDLSVLIPGWLKAHVHAADHGYVLCGTTCKHKKIIVSDEGEIEAFEAFLPGRDSRLSQIKSDFQQCSGSWLFGGTFSVPMELTLKVNGQDEIHDIIGGEDYDFGIRLERAGATIQISRLCGTYEDEDGHHAEAPMVRLDKPWPGPDGPYTSNYLLNKLLRERDRYTTVGNGFSLRELRERVLAGEPFPVPTGPANYWVDGQPLAEM